MADNHDPRCRQCRREGVKLYLKGDKCYTKCTLEKTSRDGKTKWRDKPPGMHGAPAFQKKITEYGQQLREKQKLRRIYRVLENQFRNYLERRAPARRYRREPAAAAGDSLGQRHLSAWPGGSRAQARQMVTHRHFTVNGQRVNIPSYHLKPGDVIGVHETMAKNGGIKEARERVIKRGLPVWLDFNAQTLRPRRGLAELANRSNSGDIRDISEQLIIEFYSR